MSKRLPSWAKAAAAATAVATPALLFVPTSPALASTTTSHSSTLSFPGDTWRAYSISVPQASTITIKVSWSGSADLNVGLQSPSKTWVKWASSRTANPEQLTYDAKTAGTYRIGVIGRTGYQKVPFTLTVTETAADTATPAISGSTTQDWLDDQESPTHSYTQAEAVAQAKRFDVISALPRTYSAYVSAMKTANPDLRLAVYMNATMAGKTEASGFPESWFLHDSSGRRITNSWNLYLMNPASSGWISNRVTKCANLVASTGYDGCFLDNLGAGTWAQGMVSATPIDPATGKPYTVSAWLSRAADLENAVRNQTGKFVFGNGLVSGQSFFNPSAPSSVLLNGAQMVCAETFIRTAHMGITQYRSETAWKDDVDMLAKAAAQGDRVAVLTKVWASGTQQQIDGWHAFALGSFLLGANGQQVFEFSDSPNADLSAGDSMLAKLGSLGSPTAAYSVVNGVYERPYTGGLILVNPTTSSLTVSVGSGYTDALDGASVSGSVTLAPHSARLLLH